LVEGGGHGGGRCLLLASPVVALGMERTPYRHDQRVGRPTRALTLARSLVRAATRAVARTVTRTMARVVARVAARAAVRAVEQAVTRAVTGAMAKGRDESFSGLWSPSLTPCPLIPSSPYALPSLMDTILTPTMRNYAFGRGASCCSLSRCCCYYHEPAIFGRFRHASRSACSCREFRWAPRHVGCDGETTAG
jgi:hypothetical protein